MFGVKWNAERIFITLICIGTVVGLLFLFYSMLPRWKEEDLRNKLRDIKG
jgi:hypothetical protein